MKTWPLPNDSETVIITGSASQIQILDKFVCISFHTNALVKRKNLFILT